MIVCRFVFSRKIRGAATFDFCNTIPLRATKSPRALSDARAKPTFPLVRMKEAANLQCCRRTWQRFYTQHQEELSWALAPDDLALSA